MSIRSIERCFGKSRLGRVGLRQEFFRRATLGSFAGLLLAAGLVAPTTLLAEETAESEVIAISYGDNEIPSSSLLVKQAMAAELNDESISIAQQPARPTTPARPAPARPGQPRRPATPPPVREAPQLANEGDFALSGANQSLGGATSQTASSPYMIGDFYSSAGQIIFRNGFSNMPQYIGEIPSAGGSRRTKISENNSPIPRDRVFYAFNYFDNAIQAQNQLLDVARHTPGFEKTFLDGLGSIDIRLPISYTQNSDVFADGSGALKNTEIGNMTMTLKLLLLRNDEFALAAGAGVNLPTADDTRILGGVQNPQPLLRINNDSVHIMPYLGALWTPGDRFYMQSYVQVDVDAGGNGVLNDQGQQQGILNEQTLLYADIAVGYWLMRDDNAPLVTGIIPTIEFHYTTSLQNADIVQAVSNNSQLFTLGNIGNRFDVTNATAGVNFRLGSMSFFTVAGVVPLQSRDENRQFDSEIVAQFNRLF